MKTKVVTVPDKVDDLYGLYIDLRKSEFLVKNVGADERGTYVHLDETEMKDPVPVVESWFGRPAPEQTLTLHKKRVKEMEEVVEMERKNEERRVEEDASRAAEADAKTIDPNMVIPYETEESGSGNPEVSVRESFIKKLWKKLF